MHAFLAIILAAPISGKVTLEGDVTGPVVVYIERVANAPAKKDAAPATLAQKDTEFAPRVLITSVGQKVEFPNQDAFYHNVFSVTSGNQFDLGLYRGGLSKAATMRAPGEVDVFCNIHPNMAAKILVLQNDLYAQANKDGSYSIADVPDGHYTLVAWSAGQVPEKREIDVKGKAHKADFALKARKQEDHLNKDGEQYGRYK